VQLAVALGLLATAAGAAGQLAALDPPPDAAWWQWLGGLASAFYVTSMIVLFPRLGAVVTVGLVIAGQIAASLVIDGAGLLGVEREAIGAGDASGALLGLAGAALIVRSQASQPVGGASGPRRRVGSLLLALAAGAVLPLQGAVNAGLRGRVGEPLTVGAVSFVVATAAMLLVLALALRLHRAARPDLAGLSRTPWWGWLGGLCGAVYVTAVFSAIPEIGAAAAIGLTVAGQQLASVVVDRYGLMRLPQRPARARRLGGVALLLVAVALIQAA
jgi:transporter family-2 protein